MAISNRLPQEMLEEIIDHLHDDPRALLTCSVATRKLVPACRFHQFSQVQIGAENLDKFFELLDVPWNSFASTVSRLVVTGPAKRRMALRCAPPTRPEYIPKDPLRLYERLSGVQTVRLVDLCPGDLSPSFWRLLEGMQGLTSVEAHRVATRCPKSFFSYLSSLPHVRAVTITQPAIRLDTRGAAPNSTSVENANVLRASVHTLVRVPVLDVRRVSNMPMHPSMASQAAQSVIEWLLAQPSPPSVTALRLNLDNPEPTTALLRRFIEGSNSASLRRLWITLPHDLGVLRSMPSLDFSTLSKLRSLHIEGLLLTHDASSNALPNFFRALFAQLFSSFAAAAPSSTASASALPPLRRISISLTLDDNGSYSALGVPLHAALHSLTWWSLPQTIADALSPFPGALGRLTVVLTVKAPLLGIDVPLMSCWVRERAWKRISDEAAMLRVDVCKVGTPDVDEGDV